MKIALKINWVLTTLLSLATGLFKILQQQADIELFEAIGFNATATTLLGIVQVVGGIMLLPKQTRSIGAWIMIPTFTVASTAVFMNQMYLFGFVSLLFIGMSTLVIYMEKISGSKNYQN
ncbi:MAG: DoxX family protein [Cyclobacteriaceae bacterium]